MSFGGQWSVGFCHRVGRDVICLELKKLYEGTPDREIRHWHAHSIAPTVQLNGANAGKARNIGLRAKELVLALTAVGEKLSTLAAKLNLPERTGAGFVGLDREFLEFNGWWEGPFVEPVTHHVPLGMDRAAFLNRCLDLDKLVIEALAERYLRPMVRELGVTDPKLDSWRGLKLLDRVACLAQVANATGLSLATSGSEIAMRLERDGTGPAQPLKRLFAISDLRQVEGHRKQDADARVEGALERFGLDVSSAASGWGSVLDTIYDGAIEELSSLEKTLAEAFTQIGQN